MGIGFCIVLLDLLLFFFVGLIILYWIYRIGWIVSAGLAGLDRLDWIGSYRLDEEDTSAFMHWLVTARMGRMVRMDWMGRLWDWGGMDGS